MTKDQGEGKSEDRGSREFDHRRKGDVCKSGAEVEVNERRGKWRGGGSGEVESVGGGAGKG